MNVKLLKKIKKHILENPKRFHMNVGIKRVRKSVSPCGTTACIAGWAVLLAKQKDISNIVIGQEFGWGSIMGPAQKLLQISYSQARRLFYDWCWPDQFRDVLAMAKNNKERAKIAGERIDYFIKNNA